jgi:hypothetical protein
MIPAARDRLSRLRVSRRCCDESGEIQVSEPATADIRKKLTVGVTVLDGQAKARNGDGFAGTDMKYATLGVTTTYQRPKASMPHRPLYSRHHGPVIPSEVACRAVALYEGREESLTFFNCGLRGFLPLSFPRTDEQRLRATRINTPWITIIPSTRKNWAVRAADENVVVEIPDRCPTRTEILKHIVRVAVAVKVGRSH